MKILALDLGDKWIGSAISDVLAITCKPYETTTIENIDSFLKNILHEELIDTIVIGLPITTKGTESEQTKKTILFKKSLENKFNLINGQKIEWVLWDERFSSKRANAILNKTKKTTSKNNKQKDHNIAAAFILQSYLDNKAFHK